MDAGIGGGGRLLTVAAASDPTLPWSGGIYTPLSFVAAAVAVAFALVLWRARGASGAPALLALAFGAAWWSFLYGLELSSTTLAAKLLFGRLSYLGIAVVPVAWATFALAYTGRLSVPAWRTVVPLSVPAVLVVGLPWTSGTNDLFWASTTLVDGVGTPMALSYGPLFWLWSGYAYLLLAGGTVLLFLSMPSDVRLFRRQSLLLLVGVVAPWVANAAYLARVSPGALDFTPLGFVVSAVALGGGAQRYRLFEVNPAARAAARDELVEGLADAVFVLNESDRILDVNRSARDVLGAEEGDLVGASLRSVAPTLAAAVASADDGPTAFTPEGSTRHYELRRSTPEEAAQGRFRGTLVTLHDVTERRHRELRLAVLNRVLRHDLRNDLSVIEGYARLLVEGEVDESYATVVADRAAGSLDLIGTVREVGRALEAGGSTHAPVDVVRVVTEQATAASHAHPEATVELDTPDTAMAFAGDLLPSAVDNLVENAIEHNDRERPHVQVTVERATTDGVSHVEIRVADDGPGIPDTDRRLLVGDPDARLEEATGLGLWLVNWIVTESGGSVSYAPNEPRGSVVTVRLPTEGDGDDGRDDGRRLDTTHRTPRRVPIDGRAGDTAAPQTRSGPSSNANGAS